MAIIWNPDLLDERVAEGFSAFTEAEIPEVATRHAEAEHWMINYLLNVLFRAKYEGLGDGYAGLYLRRVAGAYEEYGLARQHTRDFLRRTHEGEQPIRTYLVALRHWEQCLSAAWQAATCIEPLTGNRLFLKNDGSDAQRLNRLHVLSKHTDEFIGDPTRMPPNGQVAVWMTNEGLASVEAVLGWSELAEVLHALGDFADRIQDPLAAGSPVDAEQEHV